MLRKSSDARARWCWRRRDHHRPARVAPFAIASGDGKNLLLGGARNPGSDDRGRRSPARPRSSPTTPPTAPASPTSPTTAAARSTAVAPARRHREGQRALRARQQPGRRPRLRVLLQRRRPRSAHHAANPNAAPFTTNAHGVATGLNADKVDGKSAADITKAAHDDAVATAQGMTSFAGVAADGKLGAKRGATRTSARQRQLQGDVRQRHLGVRHPGDRGDDHQRRRRLGGAAAATRRPSRCARVPAAARTARARPSDRPAVPHHGHLLTNRNAT